MTLVSPQLLRLCLLATYVAALCQLHELSAISSQWVPAVSRVLLAGMTDPGSPKVTKIQIPGGQQKGDTVACTIFCLAGDMTRQYAYFVKFNEDECNKGLQSQDIANALTVDVAAGIRATVMKREIYHGDRMVAACAIKQGKRYKHSEYRLLNIPAGSTESPISSLLKKDPAAGCVVFYSLNSPCVEFCTDPDGPYNIIDKLNQVNLPPYNSRAFAYTKVFDTDKERPRADVWKNWKALNAKMQLIRCTGNNCIQCLDNNDVKNEQCLD